MYGDTEAIRAHARRQRERAEDIRELAHTLLVRAEVVPWSGVAADAMRCAARDNAAALRACADAHARAAEALLRHAQEVDLVKDLIASIERRALGVLESAASGVAGVVAHVVPNAVDRWASDFEPPPHGSRAWLDVRLPAVA
jgi:hypothetical protein